MRFTYLDFYLLSSDLEGALPDALVTSKAADVMPFIPTKDVLQRSVSKLIGEGFLEYSGGRLEHTEKAKVFLGDKRFFEGKKKRECRLMNALCKQNATPSDFRITEDDATKIVSRLREMYHIRPTMALSDGKLIFKSYAEQNEDDDCESCEFTLTDLCGFAKDALTVSAQMCAPCKARKLCVEADGGSYVLTLFSEGDAIRIKAQKILFNRKRFSGKLNSDLDYAQCGDVLLDVKCSRLEFFESVALIALHIEDEFTETDYENLNKITL